MRRFSYGLGKKVIISNVLARDVDTIVSLEFENVTGIMAWTMAIFYTLQIYYDFSGYSDMAIELAKLFGFDIEKIFTIHICLGQLKNFGENGIYH